MDRKVTRIKGYTWLLVIALAMLTGLYFINRMHRHDIKAVKDFMTAYKEYDDAVLAFSIPAVEPNMADGTTTENLKRKADLALAGLDSKASVRLSSFLKNDAELMNVARRIANLSREELAALETFGRSETDSSVDLNMKNKEPGALTNERKQAYARFEKLLRLND